MRTLKRALFSLLTCLICLNTVATPTAIKTVILFGDSLSDTGNDYAFSYLLSPIIKRIPSLKKQFPSGLIPSPYGRPYFRGRFSDGKNWFEDFANLFHVRDTELHHYGHLENFAYGGAWASTYTNHGKRGITIFPLDIQEQILQFDLMHPFPYLHHNHVLAVIFIGANDYLTTDMSTPVSTQVDHAVNAIKAGIKQLHNYHHITHFLLMGMPDLSQTPYATHLSDEQRTRLRQLSVAHNQRLTQLSTQLNAQNSQLPYHTTFINWLSDHQELNQHYQQYHFRYAENRPCHNGFPDQAPLQIAVSPTQFLTQLLHNSLPAANLWTQAPHATLPNGIQQRVDESSQCTDLQPSGDHIYMDDVHPTRLAQCIIALRTCSTIQSQYTWVDGRGREHALNCGTTAEGLTGLQQAADQCYAALQAGDLRKNTLLPFENQTH